MPDDDAGLRTAEQFVAGEADQVHAGSQAFLDGRFVGQSIAGSVEQRTGPKVVHARNAVAVCQA